MGVMMEELSLMAKKKTSKPAGRGRPPRPGGAKLHVLGVRGSQEWKDWVVALAAHCRLDLGDLVDQGLVELAKVRGFEERPPKR